MPLTIKEWEERIRQASETMRPLVKLMKKSVHFFYGQQDIIWHRGKYVRTEELFPTPNTSGKSEVVCNIFRPRAKAVAARIMLDKPMVTAFASSNDLKRINASQYANKAIKRWEYSADLESKQNNCALLLVLCGISYWKIFWNRDIEAEYLNRNGEVVTGIIGDVAFEVVPPTEIILEPGKHSTDEADWWVHRVEVSRKFAEKAYGKSVSAAAGDKLQEIRMAYGSDASLEERTFNSEYDQQNTVIVCECYERIRMEGADGIPQYQYKITTIDETNAQVLAEVTLDYNPFVPVVYDYVEGTSIPTTPAFDAILIQAEMNTSVRRISEYIAKTSDPPLYVNKLTTRYIKGRFERGKIVEGSGVAPRPIDFKPIDAATYQYPQQIMLYLDHIFGIHQVSQGITPYADSSGRLVQSLQSQDLTNLSTVINNFKRSYLRVITTALKLAQKNYSQQRHIAIAGMKGYLDVVDFTGAQLDGGTDVRLVSGGNVPLTPDGQLSFALNLFQSGALRPDRKDERKELFKMLKIGDWTEDGDQLEQERDNAELENRMMEQGKDVPPQIFEMHDIHLDIIEKHMQTQQYRQLQPQSKALFMKHRQLHKTLRLINAIQEAQEMQAVQMAVSLPPAAGGGAGFTPLPASPPNGEGGGGQEQEGRQADNAQEYHNTEPQENPSGLPAMV